MAPRLVIPRRIRPLKMTGRRPILSERGPINSCDVANTIRKIETVS